MGSSTSKIEPTQRNDYVSPNPWYTSLNVPQRTTVAPDEPLLQGSSFHISLYPSTPTGTATADIYLANTVSGTSEKQYSYYFTLLVQQNTDIKLRYTKSGKVFYTLHGAESPLQSKGLNFQRPLYIHMELRSMTYDIRSTLDVDLLYVENVENYVGAPNKQDLCPDRLSFNSKYEIVELLLNHNTRKVFVDEPLIPGTKLYLTASHIHLGHIYYVHVYLTNTSPRELNEGEVTLVPFDMTYYLDRCESPTVIKLRHTWNGQLIPVRNRQATCCDESKLLKPWLDTTKSIYVFVELCNMALDVSRMEDGDADDEENIYTVLARFGNLLTILSRNTPPFQLWNGLERSSFPEFPAGNSGKDDLSKPFQRWNAMMEWRNVSPVIPTKTVRYCSVLSSLDYDPAIF